MTVLERTNFIVFLLITVLIFTFKPVPDKDCHNSLVSYPILFPRLSVLKITDFQSCLPTPSPWVGRKTVLLVVSPVIEQLFMAVGRSSCMVRVNWGVSTWLRRSSCNCMVAIIKNMELWIQVNINETADTLNITALPWKYTILHTFMILSNSSQIVFTFLNIISLTGCYFDNVIFAWYIIVMSVFNFSGTFLGYYLLIH
jgi:hypothetical protein